MIRSARGLTLIELLVTLLILSILASAALPYAEITVRRNNEIELRRALREIRDAIDRYHEELLTGKIPKTSETASEDKYPRTLRVLTEGVPLGDQLGKRRIYLRRIPIDPFADQTRPAEEQWVLRSYQDERASAAWSGRDVYDIRSASEQIALDGSRYRDW